MESQDKRGCIVAAAIDLLTREGREAVTTRAVATASGVQAPTLYRMFGDKRGLLDAVAEHGFRAYMAEKGAHEPSSDPVEDLRRGWDLHVEFGLARPAIYALMYADPRPGERPPIAETAYGHLRALMRRIAAAGRLRVGEERAAELVHAAACGTVLTLLSERKERLDLGLSKSAREAVLNAILVSATVVGESNPAAAVAAAALRSQLAYATCLSEAERALLAEWLDRITTPSVG